MTARAAWRPILDGPAAEQAGESIAAIAASLGGSIPPGDSPTAPPLARHVTLESGQPGLALFYAYLAQAGANPSARAEAERLWDLALEGIPRIEVSPTLYEGAAGFGWAAAHLQRLGVAGGSQSEAVGRWADERLLSELARPLDPAAPDNYDLLYGLVGLGVCALERLPEPSAARALERVVARLADQAEHRPDGVTWWTPPIHTGRPEEAPHGWYNLGLAHGIPGIIGFLGLVCAANVAAEVARPLLDGAVSWLLAQRRDSPTGSQFVSYVGEGIGPRPARLAWCYGDPGIAAALLVAARAVGQPDWEREAIALALHATGRSPEGSYVVDASFCHGAIGLGHLFNRVYQASGEPALAEASRFWFERGLAMRRPGGKLGGFFSLTPDADGKITRRVAFRGLIQGSAGIGLALVAATSEVEPAWDRLFLLS